MIRISSKGRIFFLAVVIICLLALTYVVNVVFVLNSLGGLFDFGSFVASGQYANLGKNPYLDESPLIFSVTFLGNGLKGDAPNLNPPISVLIFQTFANVNPHSSIAVWRITTFVMFVIAIFILQREYPIKGYWSILRWLWAFGLAGFWHTLQLGQIYTLILLLTVFIWILLSKKQTITAGIFLGILIAIKPNFVFWAVLLAVAGNWRAFFSSGLCAITISAIPLVTHGFGIYIQWLEASSIFTPNLLLFPGNNSFQGLTARFGLAEAGTIISILFSILIGLYVYKVKPTAEKTNALAIISSLFISPIAWTGYTLLTLPIFYEKNRWEWSYWIAASIFAIPFIIPLMLFTASFLNFIIFGWFYGWGLSVLLLELLSENSKQKTYEEFL